MAQYCYLFNFNLSKGLVADANRSPKYSGCYFTKLLGTCKCINLGGVGVFVIHGYLNFTLLNKAFVEVKANYNFTTQPEICLRLIWEAPLANEQRFCLVFILKTEIIFLKVKLGLAGGSATPEGKPLGQASSTEHAVQPVAQRNGCKAPNIKNPAQQLARDLLNKINVYPLVCQ